MRHQTCFEVSRNNPRTRFHTYSGRLQLQLHWCCQLSCWTRLSNSTSPHPCMFEDVACGIDRQVQARQVAQARVYEVCHVVEIHMRIHDIVQISHLNFAGQYSLVRYSTNADRYCMCVLFWSPFTKYDQS